MTWPIDRKIAGALSVALSGILTIGWKSRGKKGICSCVTVGPHSAEHRLSLFETLPSCLYAVLLW
jgi:hypothetical protein